MRSTSTAPEPRPLSWRERRAAKRFVRRVKAQRKIRVPVPEPLRQPAPERGRVPAWLLFTALFASAAGHLAAFAALPRTTEPPPSHGSEELAIVVLEPEPEPEPEPLPEPEPEPEPEPVPPPTPEDAVPFEEPPDAAPEPPPTEEPRRIVGLNLDSTTTGGSGPRYAIGNTRMGTTARTASNPTQVAARPPAPVAPKGKVKKPRRMGQATLGYPEELERQGVEADVRVEVDIDEQGAVTAVRILEAPPEKAFVQAATEAARKERYKPATAGGKPIPYTLSYTYRFRITH